MPRPSTYTPELAGLICERINSRPTPAATTASAAALLPFGAPFAAAAVLVAGIGRELIRPPFDVRDLAATIAGGDGWRQAWI